MDILNVWYYPGRNIFCHRPVIKVKVDIGVFYDTPTKDIGNFNDNILELFPGFKSHYCSYGCEGGFVRRLTEGTYLTHVTEHLILELQNLVGYDVSFGKSQILEEPSVYYLVFEYINEKCAAECLIYAVNIINSLIEDTIPDTNFILSHLKKVACETGLGPSTKAIYEEAMQRRIPVICMGSTGILQLGCGKYSRNVEASLTDSPGCISVDIVSNKHLTKQILMSNGIPVPYGDISYTEQSACFTARQIGFPVVIKPFDANQGKGVTLEIWNETEVVAAFKEAIKYSIAVIVEKYIRGRDYRVLIVDGRVAAAAERIPPCVMGDGCHTIKELVGMENKNPERGENHEKPLTKIKLDSMAMQVLMMSGMIENDIPSVGTAVFLRHNGNLSTGGTARDCTDEMHTFNAGIAIKAAELLELDIAGIDITAEDISRPIGKGNGAIIEVNAAPGLRMHLFPTLGKPRNVAANIVDMLFPPGKPFTVPIVSVAGTNGKTTTVRLIAHTLALTGKTVGMTSTSGVYIGNECILKGDSSGPVSAGMVLSNKNVEVAVLETARGGIIKKGLGYDLADVGVIVNISDDHLGADGIGTIDDLAGVKSLVIEAVRDNGYAVLNADDKMTPFFIKRINCKLIMFTRDFQNPLISEHIGTGGRAVFERSGSIYICSKKGERYIARIEEIPITLGGIAGCNIENSLAAVSALYALNIPIGVIKAGLKTFRPNIVSNPGRFNIFDLGGFKIMLDYGHNVAGYDAVINCISGIEAGRHIGIIGMPGDRSDKSIRDVGVLCGRSFSPVYIKEDNDLRGRDPGEVADILYNAVVSSGMKKEKIKVVYSEVKALEMAILDAQPGDFIVMFYEEFGPALELIESYTNETGQNEVSDMRTERQATG